MSRIYNVGIVGAGAISGIYLENITGRFPNLRAAAICSRHRKSAEEQGRRFGLEVCTLDEMLDKPDVDIIVNLTPVGEHYGIIKKALLAGKHVYTEKTISESTKQAEELCAIAEEKGLYLGSAPDTFLGSALQSARKALDEGLIGEVNSFSISVNRSNDFLTGILPFLRLPGAGALRDYGVYYVTALTALLGPVSRVCAFTRTPYTQRLNTIPGTADFGQTVITPNESVVTAVIELESGVVGTLHQDHESCRTDRADFAIYGRKGIMLLNSPNYFGGTVKVLRDQPEIIRGVEQEHIVITLAPGNKFSDNSRGLGVAEMAESISTGKKNRTSKELAMHVLDVLESIETSSRTGRITEVKSTCERPRQFYSMTLTGKRYVTAEMLS